MTYRQIFKEAANDADNQVAARQGADVWAGLRDSGRFANRTVGNIIQNTGIMVDAPISLAKNIINYPLYLAGKKFLGQNHGFTRAMQPGDLKLVQRITTPINRTVHQQNQYQQPHIMNNAWQKALGGTAQLSAGLAVPVKGLNQLKAAKPVTTFLTTAFPKYGPKISAYLNSFNTSKDKLLNTGMKVGGTANVYDLADDYILGATYTPSTQVNPQRAAMKDIVGTVSALNPKKLLTKQLLRYTPAWQQGVMRPAAKLTFGPLRQNVIPTAVNAGIQAQKALTSKPAKAVYISVRGAFQDPVAQNLAGVVATSPGGQLISNAGSKLLGIEDKINEYNAIKNRTFGQYLQPNEQTLRLMAQRQKDMQVYGNSSITPADIAGTLQPSMLLRLTTGQRNPNRRHIPKLFGGFSRYTPKVPVFVQQADNAVNNGRSTFQNAYSTSKAIADTAGKIKQRYDNLTPVQKAMIHAASRAVAASRYIAGRQNAVNNKKQQGKETDQRS